MRQLYTLIVGVDPRQLQFDVAVWTRGLVRQLIRREFGVAVSVVGVGRLLHMMGLSARRPLHR
jgi:transposase